MNKYNKEILKKMTNFELVKILKNCMFYDYDYETVYCPQCPLKTIDKEYCDRDLISQVSDRLLRYNPINNNQFY